MAPQTETQRFFADLTWETLESKIADALKDPSKSVPLETPCPAVYSLVTQIITVCQDSTKTAPGENLSVRELLNADQRLAVMRILEAVISSYEDWKVRGGRSPITGSSSVLASLAAKAAGSLPERYRPQNR